MQHITSPAVSISEHQLHKRK